MFGRMVHYLSEGYRTRGEVFGRSRVFGNNQDSLWNPERPIHTVHWLSIFTFSRLLTTKINKFLEIAEISTFSDKFPKWLNQWIVHWGVHFGTYYTRTYYILRPHILPWFLGFSEIRPNKATPCLGNIINH